VTLTDDNTCWYTKLDQLIASEAAWRKSVVEPLTPSANPAAPRAPGSPRRDQQRRAMATDTANAATTPDTPERHPQYTILVPRGSRVAAGSPHPLLRPEINSMRAPLAVSSRRPAPSRSDLLNAVVRPWSRSRPSPRVHEMAHSAN